MTWFHVYVFTRLDALNAAFAIALVSVIAVSVMMTLYGFFTWEGGSKLGERVAKRTWKWALPTCFLLGICLILAPTTNQFAAIYILPKVVNNEQVQQIPDNTLKIINMKFEEWINNLEPTKKE